MFLKYSLFPQLQNELQNTLNNEYKLLPLYHSNPFSIIIYYYIAHKAHHMKFLI